MTPRLARRLAVVAACLSLLVTPAAVAEPAGGPAPGTPEYIARDLANMAASFGRIWGDGGQLDNPAYLPALVSSGAGLTAAQWLEQAARVNRPSFSGGMLVPGWNVGNPLRAGWAGTRGQAADVSYTNRYGALIRGTVFAPKAGATDPYTGRPLTAPYPAVVITTGSAQASERMYWWLAQDLAERGYVVLTYDVQGQGRSETLPHQGKVADLPFCDFGATPLPGEATGCPGVPWQQRANFVFGTTDAIDFFYSTPDRPAPNPGAGSAPVNRYNPLWQLIDRTPDPNPPAPGRTTRLGIIGHSLGASAVSHVQGVDARVQTVVALDKLSSGGDVTPVVPALALHAEYLVGPVPAHLTNCPVIPVPLCLSKKAPDPMRERRHGYEAWTGAGVDSMVVVPRASTHEEWTDIPLVLPASRYGQAVSSVYTQAWLNKYLKHDPAADATLLGTQLPYLDPVGGGQWQRITLERGRQLSFYFCSAHRFRAADGTWRNNPDIVGAGCSS